MDCPAAASPAEGPDPPSGMKSTAFVVHFDSPIASKQRPNIDPPLKFTRHTRNLSLPLAGAYANQNDGASSAQQVPSSGSSPSPHSRSSILPRRVGYHSEGYFSSDQEDDGRPHSTGFPRKKENLENGAKKTSVTPERPMPHPVRPNMIRRPGDFHRSRMPALSPLPSPSSPLGPEHDDTTNNNGTTAANATGNHEGENDPENRSDSLSDAGTYTIEKESVDVVRARQAIGKIFGVSVSLEAETEPFQDGDDEDVDEEGGTEEVATAELEETNFKMSSSNGDWIDEWASRVVAHNQKSQTHTPVSPTGRSLQDDDSGRVTAHTTSPVHRPGRTSPVARPLRHNRTLSAGARHKSLEEDYAPETASLLRATESVVTAMQARMTLSLSLDSGGESSDLGRPSDDSDLEQEADVQPNRPAPTPPIRKRLSPATTETASIQTRHNRAFSLRRARLGSEKELPPSSSPAEERKKPAPPVPAPVPAPATPVTAAPAPAPAPVGRKGSLGSVGSTRSTGSVPRSQSTATNSYNSTRTNSPKMPHSKTAQTEGFARTDCGRFSMRTPKSPLTAPPKRGTTKKEGVVRNPATRSNSTLSSREVGFQNWKRRKSYDPMKAAAEGKKKEAKRTATATVSNTSAPAPAPPSPANSSSPTNNQVLRSASFHGTHGLAPGYSSGSYDMSSEDDLTVSAEERAPPLAACPSPAHLPASHAQYGVVTDVLSNSRLSLYNSPSSSPRRAKIETFDKMMISAVAEFSLKLRDHAGRLLRRLRYLYEAESSAAERLTDELELLRIVDSPANGSPTHQSSSKELSSAIRNLRRLESALLVLEDVLFEEEELVLH